MVDSTLPAALMRAVKPCIAPSILAADFLRLGEQLRAVEEAGVDRVHVDVMDGLFVPNLSLGIPIIEAVRRGTSVSVEAHLMIERPERYVADFARAGSDIIIVHQEATPQLHRTMGAVRDLGKRVSVGLNPATPLSTLADVIDDLDGILIMTVNPGFGGQPFIESTLRKVRAARELITQRQLACDVEVDGGIDERTAPLAFAAGANVLVAGTSIFCHQDGPDAGVRKLLQCCAATAPGV
jgi:ribulose-phosphate 3-epimerase